jgi:hypothetical protein
MKVKLSKPEARLPWPGVPGRVITGDEVIDINPHEPFWHACLQDSSLIPLPEPEPEPARAPAKLSKEK